MSTQLAMKLMLQLRGPRTCLERICGQEWMPWNSEQGNPGLFSSSPSVERVELCQATHWKLREETCSVKACSKRRRHPRQNQEHLQEYQQDVQRHRSEVHNEVQRKQVASRREVQILKHKLSQSLAERRQYQNLNTTSRSESSSEIQQVRHGVETLTTQRRSLETATQRWRKVQSVLFKPCWRGFFG